MEFEWDEAKSGACFEHRGFDFAYAVASFLDRKEVAEYEHNARQD